MKQSNTSLWTLITIIIMDLLTGMEFDLFVPSFPELQKHFSLSPFWLEALLSINFIGYCISLFFVGGLADRYGRKPIIMMGLMTFVIGSCFCLFIPSYYFVFLGRFLQGIGIAAPAILSFLIIADTYSLKDQQFFFAMLNGSLNTFVAIAPVVGSYIALYFHWQGNFALLLLLGLITLIMTLIFIPHYQLSQSKEAVSLLSVNSYKPIFISKPLMLLILCIFFNFIPYWIFVGMSPLLYIKDLGVSLAHFGYYQGILALVFAIGSIIFGLIIKNREYKLKNMLNSTLVIFIFSIISLILVIDSHNPLYITMAFLVFIIGQIPTNLLGPLSLNFLPEAKGRVSAMIQAGRLIFSALSLQIAGYWYQGSFRNIGIIIAIFIFMTLITLFFVTKNDELMNFSQKSPS